MNIESSQILFLVLVYLVSAIPFGLVLAKKFAGKDIRKLGSKNIGATNVARVAGKKLGLATLLLDGFKGAIMVIIARFSFSHSSDLHLYLVLVAAIAVLGHVFPIYLKFKGGKGVATSIAVLFSLDFFVGSIVVLAWIIVFLISRISSVSSLLATFSSIIISWQSGAGYEQIVFCIFLFLLISIRHKENIVRLKQGKEKKVK
jgi:glycerol-3-phosphate acyltransferase PlsY